MWLIGNFLLKITFLMRKENNDLLFQIVTMKVRAFVIMCYVEYMPSAQTFGLWGETASVTIPIFWNLSPPRCFLRGPKRWK